MKLSIIIPVYQVADTLRRCVESVTTDNGTDYEVLLVDDGSTDGSALLCDQLAADNQRISVVHTPNRGLSAARNEGLDRARGEFICFADSDDFVEPGTFNQLLPIIEADSQMDMLEFPVMEYYGGNRQRKLDLLPNVYDNMRHYWLAERAYLHTYAWNKIYRRRLFETVRYEVGRIYEDAEIL
ncbi:MAG: glycosyltransferase family 2 protein, partial [Prevotella sp.]|nr:glycosyltransferase family 2 protein [Prevotella sp.]